MRTLGKVQREVLWCLVSHGSWSERAGWHWAGVVSTARHMEALVKRSLAEVTEEERTFGAWPRSRYTVRVYRPTGAARAALTALGMRLPPTPAL